MTFTHPAEPHFPGKIGRTVSDSEPNWPDAAAPKGAPNVVLITLDDTGFAHLGCYGSTIDTPHMDRLANEGLRYASFHTTAVCSSSRACLLTGRNHHAVGVRAISNMDTGFPNMRGAVTPAAATVAEILRDRGFATFAAGKWHLAPMAEATASGPFRNWPLQKGFDRFYGFLQGETDQFYPELTKDNHFIDPPCTPEQGYHVSEDLVDQSINWLRDQASLTPEKPFFLYLAFGATHAPHQSPQAWRDKYRGRFDDGWDVARAAWFARQKSMGVIPENTELAPRNPGVKPWTDLSDGEKRFAARLQEAFAAMLDHTDAQIGRLIDFLRNLGVLDNTLVIVCSDNGASQEGGQRGVMDEMKHFNLLQEDLDMALARLDDIGGPDSHSNIPWGWAQAGNTPLKWYKQNTHGGGVRDPLIMRWPAKVKDPGAVRRQFCHAIDITPTILDAVGISMPQVVAGVPQMPLHGASLMASLADPSAPRARGVQYFEMLGHRGLWQEGWKAVTHHTSGVAFDQDDWELYHLDEDFSEARNLAAEHPERLDALVATWWREAEAHGVTPLDDRGFFELFRASRRPGMPISRRHFRFLPPISHIVSDSCPPVFRGWRSQLDIDHPEGGEGTLFARGSLNSGMVLYIQNGQLIFDYNDFHNHTVITAPIGGGRRHIDLSVTRRADGSAAVSLAIDGKILSEGSLPRLLMIVSSLGMDFGRSPRPVSPDYAPPFDYQGVIHEVVFDLPELLIPLAQAADQAETIAALSRQ